MVGVVSDVATENCSDQAILAKTLKYRNDAGSIEIAGYGRFPSVVSLAGIGG
jgi:hypothetical protein